ncbi:MAG: diguanylate cyclase [Gaiellaceae bacterium]
MSETTTPNPRRSGLSLSAQVYLAAVFAITLAAYVPEIGSSPGIDQADWRLAILLGAAAAIAQLFVVNTTRNQSYHMTPVFIVAAALLLPTPLLAFVAIAQHVPEWLRVRYPWYIQTFNIANYALAGLAAHRAFDLVDSIGPVLPSGDQRQFVAGLAAAITFVAVNHVLLAIILRLARGHSLRESGLFTLQSISTDLVLALLGVVVATLWLANPWFAVIALAPLLLIHRTLALPKLEAEARQDPKTELFNARHFSELLEETLERCERLDRPAALLIADLDLLREINNRYGHLAGDVVLAEVARTFRAHLRPEDVAARFGGEEFALLLPGLTEEEAVEVAERIRIAVASASIDVDTSSEPISATVSIGVSGFPTHATTGRDLIHRADVAAYRAKAQGRNRVVVASEEVTIDEIVTETDATAHRQVRALVPEVPAGPRLKTPPAPNYLMLSAPLRAVVTAVGVAGTAAGLVAVFLGGTSDLLGLAVLIALVAIGQALAVEVLDHGTISLTAVGALAGAALFGPRTALPLAVAVCLVDWSARRSRSYKAFFNVGAVTLSSIAGAAVFSLLPVDEWLFVAGGAIAGVAYYTVNVGLMTTAVSLETGERWVGVIRARFAWLAPHYLVYGMVGAMVAVAYDVAGVLALLVFAVPLLLVRKAQLDYIAHTEESVRRLRDASETIEAQNASLVQANVLLRDRATEAMESLAAAVDARDGYTAGHSRRVQELAVAIGREIGLDGPELESLSFAALFHDVGKLAIPDAVLLKSGPLDEDEWWIVRRHSEEGERIIGHLGFLADATPAIRHHHEHWDGSGYPDGLRRQEIPIGARILHVADALDSMVTNRVYRDALSSAEALAELEQGRGIQFCPTCVAAVRTLLATGGLGALLTTDVPSTAA